MNPATTDAREIRERFEKAGQGHVFRWWDELDDASRAGLLAQLRSVDLAQLAELREKTRSGTLVPAVQGEVEFPEYIERPHEFSDMVAWEAAVETGEALLRAGKVAALTVAGGQGTRLGYDGPKGAYPIGPVTNKTLFQIHAERVLATRRRFHAAVPWYIMTSDATDRATREYFEREEYFGLPREDVLFFTQRMMPAVDLEFKLVLVARDRILMSPNGHGGTLLALAEEGMLDDMERRGVEQISYFQVDNILVPAAEPVFIGAHAEARADMSCKALWKRDPGEPIGAFVRVGDRVIVVEYSDLSDEEKIRRTKDGKLLYGLGSIAIHMLRVDFVRRETRGGFRLPFHLAEKKSAFLDADGRLVEPKEKNVYKYETFIFDALRDSERTVILEVRREEEFSPLKNKTGADSEESCRRDLSALHAAWLAEAEIHVPRDREGRPAHPVEISPLYALDAEELQAKAPADLNVEGPLYLGPEQDVRA
jgi:UDP-N-acetylglucosamine/UDP-N-acetylgalactosamine diphosphorylase